MGLTSRLLKLVVHPSDNIKAKALLVLAGAARSGAHFGRPRLESLALTRLCLFRFPSVDVCARQLLDAQAAEAMVALLRWDDPAVVSAAAGVVRSCMRVGMHACRPF